MREEKRSETIARLAKANGSLDSAERLLTLAGHRLDYLRDETNALLRTQVVQQAQFEKWRKESRDRDQTLDERIDKLVLAIRELVRRDAAG